MWSSPGLRRLTQFALFAPDTTVDAAFEQLASAVGWERGVLVERPDPTTLTMHHRYIPGWAKALGIIGALSSSSGWSSSAPRVAGAAFAQAIRAEPCGFRPDV